ncbi:MAG: hypothetical protein ACFNOL_05290 [Treponema maltophilum]
MKKNYIDLLRGKKMTLIMSLPVNDPALARVAWENGADVVKVHINVEHRASKTVFKSFAEEKDKLNEILQSAQGPCGIVLGADTASALRDFPLAVEAGFDFWSLYARHVPAEFLQNTSIIKMIALDSNYTAEEVRALEKIGADVLEASVIKPETYGQPLTAKEILTYAAICSGTSLPVVVPTQRYIKPNDVGVLSRCKVAGIMIGAVVTGKTADTIAKALGAFRNEIDKMPENA